MFSTPNDLDKDQVMQQNPVNAENLASGEAGGIDSSYDNLITIPKDDMILYQEEGVVGLTNVRLFWQPTRLIIQFPQPSQGFLT